MLTAPNLAKQPRIAHGFFTRQGGVSEGIYASLNCGPGSKDRPQAVAENRKRATQMLGATQEALSSLYQIHSPEVVTLEKAIGKTRPQADAMVTRRTGLVLGILTADCTPVLFSDATAGVVGAAHAGWKGALSGVLEATLSTLCDLGATPETTAVAIGPTIAQASYEVGPEFRDRFLAADPSYAGFFTPGQGDRLLFDLPSFCATRLKKAGVRDITLSGEDTFADPQRFFSFRRSCHKGEDDYGRQLSAIMLQDE